LPWGATSKTLDDIPHPLKNLFHEDVHERISNVTYLTAEYNKTSMIINPQKILQRNLGNYSHITAVPTVKSFHIRRTGQGTYINTHIACTATERANVFQEFTLLKSYNLSNALKCSGIQWMSD